MADDLMTQPFLPALYVSSDWRNGQNIVWFLDISSRAPALGLVPVLFFLLLRKRPIASGVVSAVLTALSPVIGWALAASIALASLKRRPFPYRYLAPLAGAVLAMPSYYHILLLHSGSLSLTSSVSYALLKAVAITSNFVILLPLAIAGSRDMDLRTITIAGMLLLVAFPFVVLAPSNEHNLANLSQCMLAIPAGAAFLPRRKGLAAAVFLLFLPITVCTLWSFSGRPQLPLRFEEKTMHRIPGGHPLEQLYLWIEENTPREAVFVIDPDRPVKMSGNVSELPAFTSRALFVDQESYLTSPHRDARFRTELARCAVKGLVLTPEQVRYLQHLRRPLYLIAQGKVDQQYGNPVFISGPFAVFQLK